MSGKVLVLGRGTRAFLSVVRGLGEHGLHVEIAGPHTRAAERRSRHVAKAYDLPAIEHGGQAFALAVEALARAERYDLIVPVDDPEIVALQGARAQLEPLARLALLPGRAFDESYDKIALERRARELGLAVPESTLADAGSSPETLIERHGLPLVLKPPSSYPKDQLHRKAKVVLARDLGEVQDNLHDQTALGPVIAQRFVPGVGVGVGFLAERGELLLAFQHRRLHEPKDGGGSSYRLSEALDPDMEDATRRLAQALEYTGVGMLELRQADTGEFVVLELNGRFWGSLPLAAAAGVNFPVALYQLLVEGQRPVRAPYSVGLRARAMRGELGYWLERMTREGAAALPSASAELLASAGALSKERIDSFDLSDPRPAVAEVLGLAREMGQRVAAAGAGALRSAPLLASRELERARSLFAASNQLLFVCKGNICRSPYAEAVAQKLWPERIITSAGTATFAGRPCPTSAILAARALGTDLNAHVSQPLEAAQLGRADVIFVFDEANVRALRERGVDGERIVRLGPLAGVRQIADPWGEPVERFSVCYGLITRALEALR